MTKRTCKTCGDPKCPITPCPCWTPDKSAAAESRFWRLVKRYGGESSKGNVWWWALIKIDPTPIVEKGRTRRAAIAAALKAYDARKEKAK